VLLSATGTLYVLALRGVRDVRQLALQHAARRPGARHDVVRAAATPRVDAYRGRYRRQLPSVRRLYLQLAS
jgi:hypothetical protein